MQLTNVKSNGIYLCRIKKNAFGKYLFLLGSEINCRGKQTICHIQFRIFFTLHSINQSFAFNGGFIAFYFVILHEINIRPTNSYFWNILRVAYSINFNLSTSSIDLLLSCHTYGILEEYVNNDQYHDIGLWIVTSTMSTRNVCPGNLTACN